MKKAFLGTLATMVVLSMGTANAFAARYNFSGNHGICNYANSACSYADANGDGICDNYNMHHGYAIAGAICGRNFIDSNGDGICDNRGIYNQQGGNFVDANNDGICDNRTSNYGNKNGGGNFADANNDGVCDNRTSSQGNRNGHGGRHHR